MSHASSNHSHASRLPSNSDLNQPHSASTRFQSSSSPELKIAALLLSPHRLDKGKERATNQDGHFDPSRARKSAMRASTSVIRTTQEVSREKVRRTASTASTSSLKSRAPGSSRFGSERILSPATSIASTSSSTLYEPDTRDATRRPSSRSSNHRPKSTRPLSSSDEEPGLTVRTTNKKARTGELSRGLERNWVPTRPPEESPLLVDLKDWTDTEGRIASSLHVKDYSIYITTLAIGYPYPNPKPFQDITFTTQLIHGPKPFSTKSPPTTDRCSHPPISTRTCTHRFYLVSTTPTTRDPKDKQYYASYRPSADFVISMHFDPRFLPACGRRHFLTIQIEVGYDGVKSWGSDSFRITDYNGVFLPDQNEIRLGVNLGEKTPNSVGFGTTSGVEMAGFENDSVDGLENTHIHLGWTKKDGLWTGRMGEDGMGQLERAVQVMDLGTRIRDPFPDARKMVGRELKELKIPNMGTKKSLFHFRTRVPYEPGDYYDYSDEETPHNMRTLIRRQDRALAAASDPSIDPKTKVVYQLHQRWCAVNPYIARPFEREKECWTHYAAEVDKHGVRRTVCAHLRGMEDVGLLTAEQLRRVVKGMDRAIEAAKERKLKSEGGGRDRKGIKPHVS
ncbi:hypothetical protein P7C70_g5135, partial [Phenoliferia sp. Uapishka_3]